MKNNGYGKDKKRKKSEDNKSEGCDCAQNQDKVCGCSSSGEHEPEPEDAQETEGGGEIGILNKKIENLEFQLKEKDEEMLRRAADTDNYRKRLEKEGAERAKYANQAVVSDFLPVLDNIELTLQYTEEGSQLRQGIELTIKSFKDALAKYSVHEIEADPGVKFDPKYHEGIMLGEDPEYPNDAITLCVQKGYILNDRVIRPAKVRVNKIS